MPLTISAAADAEIDLATFVESVDRTLDPRDEESLAACAPALASLMRDRSLIRDAVARELRAGADLARNSYGASVFVLAERPAFFVRAVVWSPARASARPMRFDAIPHNHNFSLLTGGYIGPGYATELFELEAAAGAMSPGDRVDLLPLGRAELTPGTIMLYRAGRDVHAQIDPPALSVSLNVIVPGRAAASPQFLFDVERSVVTAELHPDVTHAANVCRLAAALDDDELRDALAGIADGASDRRVRGVARRALLGEAEIPPMWGTA